MQKKPLFDKPMSELLEIFVRARLAQRDITGVARGDAVEWLAKEKTADRPDYDFGYDRTVKFPTPIYWEQIMMRTGSEEPLLESLLNRCTPVTEIPASDEFPFSFTWPVHYEQAAREKFAADLRDLLTTFLRGGASVYLGHRNFAIVKNGNAHFIIEPEDENADHPEGRMTVSHFDFKPFNCAIAVYGVLLAEWLHRRPKWQEARELLCKMAAMLIDESRDKAEADFNSAVAVSADGTKIVRANRVVIITGSGKEQTLVEFPAEAFREQKIFRIRHPSRDGSYFPDLSHALVNQIRRGQCMTENLQILFSSRFHDDSTYLLTSERFCPSPLPEGGVVL